MLKVGGLTLEEVARATSSTVGAVKQKAHRAYERLRKLLQVQAEEAGERSCSMNCKDVARALSEESRLPPASPRSREKL